MQPTRFSKFRYALLVGLTLFVYCLDNPLKPIFWFGIGMLVLCFPAVRPFGKLKTRRSIYFWAFCFAFILVSVQMLAGLIDGLGKSPYDHSAMGIIRNIITIGAILIGHEFARHYLVNSIVREENYRVFILITLLMTLVAFPITKYTSFKDLEEIVKFLAKFLLPEFSKNLLATLLVFYGGSMASIFFLGTLDAFHWLSPILPDLKWITAALVGILPPIFLLGAVQVVYEDEARVIKRKRKENEGNLSWIVTTLASIGIVWFSVGVFSIYPSVIATGSMIPMINPGDVILVNKDIDRTQLEPGTVIQFKRDNILISHRIIEVVVEKTGEKGYRTRGDNNSGVDVELVKPEDVRGEIIKVVPKIGWPTLLIKSDKGTRLENIEF